MIREAVLDDTSCLIDLALKALSESPYSAVPPDSLFIKRIILLAITMPNMCCYVSERNGHVAGGLLGEVSRNIWGAMVAGDHAVFVDQPGDGVKLVLKFQQWAKQSGADLIRMSNSFGDPRYDALLERLGMVHTGGIHIGVVK